MWGIVFKADQAPEILSPSQVQPRAIACRCHCCTHPVAWCSWQAAVGRLIGLDMASQQGARLQWWPRAATGRTPRTLRSRPVPALASCAPHAQVIAAGYGSCSALSIFLASACRSVGIPARVAGGAAAAGRVTRLCRLHRCCASPANGVAVCGGASWHQLAISLTLPSVPGDAGTPCWVKSDGPRAERFNNHNW